MTFIVIEGPDFVGKSTIVAKLALHYMGSCERRVRIVGDPGSSSLANKVRSILNDKSISITAIEQTLLFLAARSHMVRENNIRSSDETITICDRFHHSTVVYQTKFDGIDEYTNDEIYGSLYSHVTKGFITSMISRLDLPIPDLTIFLDAPIETILARKAARGGEESRFEKDDNLAVLVKKYRSIHSDRTLTKDAVVIDASQSVAAVLYQAKGHIDYLLSSK